MRCATCTGCGKCQRPFLPLDGGFDFAEHPGLVKRSGFGAAIDLGTTTIVARVYNLATGELMHRAALLNPQQRIAADVMGRISAAMDGRLAELRDLARGALRDCLSGYDISEAVVVGNTTMLYLFAGESPKSYAVAPFAADRLFGEWMDWDGMNVRLPRCAHGFFGADAVASVRMSGMCGRGGCELMVDVGTNGEIALWCGRRRELFITSVAAGPAFERAGITGSQIISSVAGALESGAIDPTGQVVGPLTDGLDQEDVRAVQLAKAAIRAGIEVLLEKAGVGYGEISRLSIAGGLGSALDIGYASRIGLFPERLAPVAVICGNLAIEGATAALFSHPFAEQTDNIAVSARHVELGGDVGFFKAFMDAMYFPPS